MTRWKKVLGASALASTCIAAYVLAESGSLSRPSIPTYNFLPPLESVPTRASQISYLKAHASPDNPIDVFVIGAGIAGAGIALDAATRIQNHTPHDHDRQHLQQKNPLEKLQANFPNSRLSSQHDHHKLGAPTGHYTVALVDKADLGGQASSCSSKILNGGIRDLELVLWNRKFRKVTDIIQAIKERAIIMNQAPHLVSLHTTLIPCYKWWEVPAYWLAFKIYDLFGIITCSHIRFSRFVGRNETLQLFPAWDSTPLYKKSLKGSIAFSNAQINDARFALNLALTSALHGAYVLNHTEVVAFLHDEVQVPASVGLNSGPAPDQPPNSASVSSSGHPQLVTKKKVCGVRLKDHLSGSEFNVYAKTIINATGIESDRIRLLSLPKEEILHLQADKNSQQDVFKPWMIPVASVYLTLPDYYSPDHFAFILPKSKNEFDGLVLFPWMGSTIAGLSKTFMGDKALQPPTEEDKLKILEKLSYHLDIDIRATDIKSMWKHVRPVASVLQVPAPKAQNTSTESTSAAAASTEEVNKDTTDNLTLVNPPDPSQDSKIPTGKPSRSYLVDVSPQQLITVLGVGTNRYRHAAKDALDVAQSIGNLTASESHSDQVPLIGSNFWQFSTYIALAQKYKQKILEKPDTSGLFVSSPPVFSTHSIPLDISRHLCSYYGDQAYLVADLMEKGYGKRLSPDYPFVEAEVIHAARQEYCYKIMDFLRVRSSLIYLDAKESMSLIENVADLLARAHGWSRKQKRREIEEAHREMESFMHGNIN